MNSADHTTWIRCREVTCRTQKTDHECERIKKPAIDAALFRRVMGSFATGVTVITAEAEEGVRGMTANAFMSGSLDPPLCIISVSKKARMHELLEKTGHFGVSMLARVRKTSASISRGKARPSRI